MFEKLFIRLGLLEDKRKKLANVAVKKGYPIQNSLQELKEAKTPEAAKYAAENALDNINKLKKAVENAKKVANEESKVNNQVTKVVNNNNNNKNKKKNNKKKNNSNNN